MARYNLLQNWKYKSHCHLQIVYIKIAHNFDGIKHRFGKFWNFVETYFSENVLKNKVEVKFITRDILFQFHSQIGTWKRNYKLIWTQFWRQTQILKANTTKLQINLNKIFKANTTKTENWTKVISIGVLYAKNYKQLQKSKNCNKS